MRCSMQVHGPRGMADTSHTTKIVTHVREAVLMHPLCDIISNQLMCISVLAWCSKSAGRRASYAVASDTRHQFICLHIRCRCGGMMAALGD